jgi:diacylglycerol kinase (ATP)
VTRNLTLVVNPTAGKGRAQEMLPQVCGAFRDAGLETQILLSRDFSEAESMVVEAVESGVEILAVMGGDGMMHLGLNTVGRRHQLTDRRTTLGLIPAGTGNDLCRGVGLDPNDPVAAAQVIASGSTLALDLAEVHRRLVGTVVATGFDALVNGRANRMSWPRGQARYGLATLAELRVFSPLSYRLTLDGQVRTLDAMLVAIGNTSSYGGGMRVCPDADPTDGLLDVTIVHPVSRLKLLQLLPRMYSGTFVRDACIEQLRAREVVVEGNGLIGYGDGEVVGAAPLTVRSVPAAMPIFAPAAP